MTPLAFSATLLAVSTLSIMLGSIVIQSLGFESNTTRLVTMAWLPISLGLVSYAFVKVYGLRREQIGLSSASTKSLLAAGILGIVSAPLLGWIATYIRLLIQGHDVNPQTDMILLAGGSDLQWAFVALIVIIIVPIVEELLYRGVLLGFIAQVISPTKAIWVSAIIFGIAHFDVANSVGTALLGLGLGYLRVRTGSIWPPIILHMSFNAVGFTIMVKTALN